MTSTPPSPGDLQKLRFLRQHYEGGHPFADDIVAVWPDEERERLDSLLDVEEEPVKAAKWGART